MLFDEVLMVLDLVNVGSGAIWLGQTNNEYLLLGQVLMDLAGWASGL